MSRPEFLLFGDSLTQQGFETGGWVATVADLYSRKVDVINRGYSGYNSRWTSLFFKRAIQSRSAPPLLLTIWLGANDAALPDRLGAFQHVPAQEYMSNLQQMIADAKSAGIKNILLIAPPPVDDAARVRFNQQEHGKSEATELPERTQEASGRYAEACKQAGKAESVPVLDMHAQLPDGSADWKQRFFWDGLHFTQAGQQRIFKVFVDSLSQHFPHLRPEALSLDYPDHLQVNADNYAKSILENPGNTA